MPTDVITITATLGDCKLTAREGSWDGKKTLTIAKCSCNLSDVGGAGFIKDKIKWVVKGTMHAADAPTVGGIPRPRTQIAQAFLKNMKLTKYKKDGACTFETL